MTQQTTGVRRLRQIQFSPETTAGTAVDCNVNWRGTALLSDVRTLETAEEDDGWMAGGDRTYTPMKRVELALEETDATFEGLPWMLGGGINWITTGGGDTTVGQYSFTYEFGTSGVKTCKTYTFEAGDNILIDTFNYGIVSDFNISGAYGEALKMSANLVGREPTVKSAFYSTSVTTPSVETIYFNKGNLYIDAKGGTMGDTVKAATLRDFSLDVVTGFVPVETADDNIAYGHHKQVGYEITCSMTYEVNAIAKAELAAWRAETARQIRLGFTGATLSETGSTYTYKTLFIDLVGKYESFDALGDADGNDTVSCTFRGRHDASAGDSKIIVVQDSQTYT